MLIVRTEFAVNFVSVWPRRHVQVVLRRYRTAAEVIIGFDIDSCCVLFDGTRVSALPRSQRALNQAFNLVDPSRRSKSYEMRLYKYAQRGFSVAVPAFDDAKVSGSVLRMPASETQGLSRLLLYSHHKSMQTTKFPEWFADTSKALRKLEMAKSDYGPMGECEFLPFKPHLCESRILSIPIYRFISRQNHTADAPALPFVMTPDCSIEKIIRWPSDAEVIATIYGHVPVSRPTALRPDLEFIATDPGRQYTTGSFHPDDRDWFAQAYGEEEDTMLAGPGP